MGQKGLYAAYFKGVALKTGTEMANEIITKYQLDKRNYWIDEISRLSGNFVVDAEKVEQEISEEICKT